MDGGGALFDRKVPLDLSDLTNPIQLKLNLHLPIAKRGQIDYNIPVTICGFGTAKPK